MNKYLLLYRNPSDLKTEPASPEEMQAIFKQWDNWKNANKDAMLNIGDGLKPSGKVYNQGAVTDGPHIEAKEVIGGFSIIQAESYEAALLIAKTCPINHMPGAFIEIREMMGF